MDSKLLNRPVQTTYDALNKLSSAITSLSKATYLLHHIDKKHADRSTEIWADVQILQGAIIQTLRKLQEDEGKPVVIPDPPKQDPLREPRSPFK